MSLCTVGQVRPDPEHLEKMPNVIAASTRTGAPEPVRFQAEGRSGPNGLKQIRLGGEVDDLRRRQLGIQQA